MVLHGDGFIGERQEFAEHFVAARHDENDEGKGDEHLEGQHERNGVGVDLEGGTECAEVHGPTRVDGGHHAGDIGQVGNAGVTENEKTGDYRYDNGNESADQRRRRLRKRFRPHPEVAVEQHKRDGEHDGNVADPRLRGLNLGGERGIAEIKPAEKRRSNTDRVGQHHRPDFSRPTELLV